MAFLWGPDGQKISAGAQFHFAKHSDFALGVFNALPDPDVVLRKTGKGVQALRALLVDGHLTSVWNTRKSSVTKYEYKVHSKATSEGDLKALALCQEHIDKWDVYAIAKQVVSAVSYGMMPFELLWYEQGGQWHIEDVVGKPTEWFVISAESEWKLRRGWGDMHSLPAMRFMFVTNEATYNNPYGEKLFSKVFWPVQLKRNGLQWWARWIEKFGSPYLIGKHPSNASEVEKTQLLHALDEMIGSSVGTMSIDNEIVTVDPAGRAGSTQAHKDFVQVMDSEISKAIIGQTLTTELSGSTGSFAAAKVHDNVRSDIAIGDRRLVEQFFNTLFGMLVRFNIGEDAAVPVFAYDVPEDLEIERIERDAKLFSIAGKRASNTYLEQYGLSEEMTEDVPAGIFEDNGHVHKFADDNDDLPKTVEKTKKEDKRYEKKVFGLFNTFISRREKGYNKAIDKMVIEHADVVKDTKNFEDALEVIMNELPTADVSEVAHAIEELRHVGRNVGAKYAS